MAEKAELVCVTGASGFVGSWIVHLLLLRGYAVHATVRDIRDEKETEHLNALEGASTRLRLFQMDLLDYDSIFAAIKGCVGVFHVASPSTLAQLEDPQKEVIQLAVTGTKNVLMASKEAGVRRVVLTSSIAAIFANPNAPSGQILNENMWSDEEYCERNRLWYFLAKVRAEKAAWRFAEETGLDIVVILPSMVLGPMIQPTLNESMGLLLAFLQGSLEEAHQSFLQNSVHVKDVAQVHILLYENPSAKGRHVCARNPSSSSDFIDKLGELYPEYAVSIPQKSIPIEWLGEEESSKKLIELGLEFTPLEQILRDSVGSLKSRGFLS